MDGMKGTATVAELLAWAKQPKNASALLRLRLLNDDATIALRLGVPGAAGVEHVVEYPENLDAARDELRALREAEFRRAWLGKTTNTPVWFVQILDHEAHPRAFWVPVGEVRLPRTIHAARHGHGIGHLEAGAYAYAFQDVEPAELQPERELQLVDPQHWTP
jgi:hypothetical protein